jgi:uncharacterized membrane protein
MTRRVSFRPALTLRGRKFKGLRGWSGKPLHPPLTDIPIGAYLLATAFDLISQIGQSEEWARDFYRAATFTFVGGAIVAVPTALTGFWDWLKSTEPGTQVRREANAHAMTMVTVTVLVLTNIGLRVLAYPDDPHSGVVVLALSLVISGLVTIGAAIGGSLVYDHGFNVENASDVPAYHPSPVDVLPDGSTVPADGDGTRASSASPKEQAGQT